MLEAIRIDETLARPAPEPENFIGRVRMLNLAAAGGTTELELLAVFFDAGARTRPHVHPTDQVLVFLQGTGFVSFPDQPEQLVEEGSVVVVPAGLVHMHGATEAGPVCHLALRAPGATDWSPRLPAQWQRYAR